MTRVAVAAGTGKTGRAVGSALTAAGLTPVPLGSAAWTDLPAALTGCGALVVIAPNLHPDEPGYVATLLDAAGSAGVTRVVYHSVVVPYAPTLPHQLGRALGGGLVRRSGLGWTILQPCAYLQNLLPGLREQPPELVVAYSPDSPFGLVDLVDVASAHAAVLTSVGHVGATYELGGPDLVTVRDVAAAAARLLEREVPVRCVPVEDWYAGAGAGLPVRERDWLAAMFSYYDAHGLPAGGLVSAALLGREPSGVGAVLARELGIAQAGVPPGIR